MLLSQGLNFKDVGDSTVRTYVKELREKYHIPKSLTHRSYEALEELPKGKQLQVDFGEIKLKTYAGETIKLYVIAFVLSHSRFKYAYWQTQPFTTRDVLRCHEQAFEYYGGMTEEIVYDQDKLMTVSENGGDIIYTEEFQSYRKQRGFRVYLCRAADPESKGKVESVVKFIKRNFAKNRVFHLIETWNEQCLAWLERKGNYQVHNTIKKRPIEVFALEKPHLRKVSSLLSFESNHKTPESEPLAVHLLSKGKGQLIKNRDLARDKSKGLEAYMNTVMLSFEDQEKIQQFIDEIAKRYPRYVRDQLQILQRTARDYNPFIQSALDVCIQKNLWSANDFRDVTRHLAITQKHEGLESFSSVPSYASKYREEKATVRELDGYLRILGGA